MLLLSFDVGNFVPGPLLHFKWSASHTFGERGKQLRRQGAREEGSWGGREREKGWIGRDRAGQWGGLATGDCRCVVGCVSGRVSKSLYGVDKLCNAVPAGSADWWEGSIDQTS